MSVYTLLLFLAYFILIVLILIVITASLPIRIVSETHVDGFNFRELVEFYIFLGFIGGKGFFDTNGGSFQVLIASIPVYTSKWSNKEDKKEEKGKDKESESKKRGNFRILVKPGRKLLISILKKVKLQFDLDLEAGLSDPYLCGLIFGFIYPTVQFIELYCKSCNVSVTPVFIGDSFRGRLIALIQFTPILFVYPLLRFFTCREFREYRNSRGNR